MRGGATQFAKGHVPWNAGRRIEKNCQTCGAQMSVKRALAERTKYCSKACYGHSMRGRPSPWTGQKASPQTRAKQRAAKLGLRGPEHWNWRGGKRSVRKTAMGRDEYVQWRWAVFTRDDFTCQECGVRGVLLHADHIKPWAEYPDDRYKLENGRTLCAPCHWLTPTFPIQLIPRGENEIGQ